jgi:short-subunit dehydrogenase
MALITGASSGIGAELARLCAAAGYDLVLVARRAAELEKLSGELASKHGIDARVLTADLAEEDAPERILRALESREIDVLINNAGFGVHGAFWETDWEAEHRLLQVNVMALVRMTKLVLPGMRERGKGRILNVASTAAFVPGPFMALYYASKALVFSFSLALSSETKGTGVTVTALCPGPTTTEFQDVAGLGNSNLFQGSAMTAAEVAREGFEAMMAGRAEVIAGGRNRLMMLGTRLAPRSLLAAVARRLNSSVK